MSYFRDNQDATLTVMDLDDVRIFTKVAEAGSFTKAAQLLDMPKSTVSRRVAELEDELNVLLIQRSTRKLTLTHAGQLYFERTSRAIDDLNQAKLALDEMQAGPRGVLRLTVPSDMSGLLPRLIRDFRTRYENVELVIFSTGRRVDLIAEGYDVALRAAPRLSDSTMHSKKIMDTRFGVFASPEYLEKHGTPTTPEELTSHECLTFFVEGMEHRQWDLHHALSGKNIPIPVSGTLSSNDLTLLMGACENGLGIAFLPTFEPELLVTKKRLIRLLPDYTSEFGALYAVYPTSRHVSPNVRAFVDFASEWFSECNNVWHSPCDS